MLKNNLALKLVGLLIAVLIWLQIAFQTEQQSVLNFPVELKNSAPGEAAVPTAKKVPFNVSGKGLDILRLRLSKLTVQFNAEQFSDPKRELSSLEYSLVNRPTNLDVDILGPVPELTVAALSGDNRQRPKNSSGNGRTGRDSSSRPGTKAAQTARRELTATRVLENVTIVAPAGNRAVPSTATLKVEGSQSGLASLPMGITIIAEDKPDASGTHQLNVRLPEGITLVDLTPKRVRLLK